MASIDTINANLAAPGAGPALGLGGEDVLEIDLDKMGAMTCTARAGNANNTFNDRIEIGHCTTPTPTDLCIVVDRAATLTAFSIAGPGLGGVISPADDAEVDLAAGTYSVSMTVSGAPLGFSFTILDVAPNDQRILSAPIMVGAPDTEKPVIAAVSNVTISTDAGLNTANVSFAATVSDNVDPASSFTPVFMAGGSVITSPFDFPVGATTVTVTANADAAGNVPDPITFSVTVNDAEMPVIAAVPNVTVGTDLNTDTANVSFATTVSDNVDAASGFTPVFSVAGSAITSPFDFQLGLTTVTVTANADAAGNVPDPISFTVTVSDQEKPNIAAVPNVTVPTDADVDTASVSFATTVSDNVDAASGFTPIFSVAGSAITSPFDFPLGVTTVTVTANADAAGNIPDPISFTVTVSDPEKPVIAAVPNVTIGTDPGVDTASVSFATTVSDNVDPASGFTPVFTANGTAIASPFDFPIGTTSVTVTANADSAGNTPDPVTFVVTVTEPEIDVSSSASGVLGASGSDMQGSEQAGVAQMITYTIENQGSNALTLTGAPTVSNLVNVNSPILVGPLSATLLAPTETATFTVTYTPTLAGPFSFEVTVPSDDADEGDYRILVSGNATGGPEIGISSSETGQVADGGDDLHGTQDAGVAKVATYTIENSGTDTLILGGTPTATGLVNVEGPIAISLPSALSLEPGEMASFSVTYVPIAGAPYSFDLAVQSNDADEATYVIGVSGSGNAAPSVILSGPTGAQSGPFTVTATFSEPVFGLELSDFTVGNGSVSGLQMTAPDVYTVLVTPTIASVEISVSLPANTVTDQDTAANSSSNLLTYAAAALSVAERDDLRDIVVQETVRTLRTEIAVQQRAVKDARERFAAGQRCRALEDADASTGPVGPELQALCRQDQVSRGNVPLSFDGTLHATEDHANLAGSFFGQYSAQSGNARRLVFGDLDVSQFNGGDVTASLNGRIAWETVTADAVLFGYFVGATASQTSIKDTFAGTRSGYGLSTGAYFVDQLDENLFWDGFVSFGFGQNDLDLGNGTVDVAGNYATKSVQVGVAVSGIKAYEGFELRPEFSLAYGYTQIGDVALDVTTLSSSVEELLTADAIALGVISFTPEFVIPDNYFENGEIRVVPSLSCEILQTTTRQSDCGGGLALGWSTKSNDGLSTFSATVSRDIIGDETQDSFGLLFQKEF